MLNEIHWAADDDVLGRSAEPGLGSRNQALTAVTLADFLASREELHHLWKQISCLFSLDPVCKSSNIDKSFGHADSSLDARPL
jgi:hypothetical protein